jgi:hypothetical protein
MKKFALVLACFTALGLKAQHNNFNQSPVKPMSPDATQFIRYGDIPMDYSTGVPNITIPLHTIISGKISLPIDMSYNASGIKVLDIASTVGLGWSLNAGGLISRTVLGTDDQLNKPKAFLSSSQALAEKTQCFSNLSFACVLTQEEKFKDAFNLFKETQSDRFFYSFNGRSGVFRTDYETGIAKTIPYSALKVSTGTNNAGPYTITAEDGTKYIFEQPEFSASLPFNPGYNSSYYLTKIESADLTQSINIYYKNDDLVGQIIKSYQIERIHIDRFPPLIETKLNVQGYAQTSVPVMPDSITSANETVIFEYIADRPDPRKSRLKKIKILNRFTREIIKIVELQHSYFGTAAANNRRLRLDNVYVKDNANTTGQQYGFSYNGTPLPPYYQYVGIAGGASAEHFNVDYWGYYNGADATSLLPKEFFEPIYDPALAPPGGVYFTPQDQALYGGNRNPNPATAQACILTEITYPTGGKTSFEYELNRVQTGYAYYPIHPTPEDFGGLRVKKITSTADAVSPPIIKSYKYGGGYHTVMQEELFKYNSTNYDIVEFITGLYTPIRAEYQTVNTCILTTDPFLSMSTGGNALVVYNDVIEYSGTEANNNGYVEYIYDNSNLPHYAYDAGISGNPRNNGAYLTDYGNYKPRLQAKIVYGKDQNNNVKQLTKEEYTYNSFNNGTFITGLKLTRDMPYVKFGIFAGLQFDCDVACFVPAAPGTCQSRVSEILGNSYVTNTEGVLDVQLPTQKKETIYATVGTGSLITTTDYTYDLTTLQPIEEKATNSKGEILLSVNKYPTDFSSSAPYNTMVAKNILTPVVEQLAYKNNVSASNFLNATKTNYDYWNGTNWSASPTNIIVPKTVDTRSKDQVNYETRMRYFSYDDKGNLTTVAKENDVKKTYMWGYNKTYPVAEITGADFATASSYIIQSVLDNPADDISLRSHLNNLRNMPGALVTTYTYKPLVGMTSQTDANGKTIYYEYDRFNRLVLVRDKDNNVIKKICYSYAGQPEDCTVNCTNFTPNWQNTTTALRCQQGSCGNTGYQEQEQKDMNPCSPTYNQTQWVAAGYNPTACPAQTCVPLTSTNIYGIAGFTASYYNTATGITYYLPVPATTGLQPLGNIPSGNYNLTISRAGSNVYGTYYSGCKFQAITGSTPVVFYNVPVSPSGCKSITLDLAN